MQISGIFFLLFVHILLKMNTVHNPSFFNKGGKKGGKVVKSGKNLHIFVKIFNCRS